MAYAGVQPVQRDKAERINEGLNNKNVHQYDVSVYVQPNGKVNVAVTGHDKNGKSIFSDNLYGTPQEVASLLNWAFGNSLFAGAVQLDISRSNDVTFFQSDAVKQPQQVSSKDVQEEGTPPKKVARAVEEKEEAAEELESTLEEMPEKEPTLEESGDESLIHERVPDEKEESLALEPEVLNMEEREKGELVESFLDGTMSKAEYERIGNEALENLRNEITTSLTNAGMSQEDANKLADAISSKDYKALENLLGLPDYEKRYKEMKEAGEEREKTKQSMTETETAIGENKTKIANIDSEEKRLSIEMPEKEQRVRSLVSVKESMTGKGFLEEGWVNDTDVRLDAYADDKKLYAQIDGKWLAFDFESNSKDIAKLQGMGVLPENLEAPPPEVAKEAGGRGLGGNLAGGKWLGFFDWKEAIHKELKGKIDDEVKWLREEIGTAKARMEAIPGERARLSEKTKALEEKLGKLNERKTELDNKIFYMNQELEGSKLAVLTRALGKKVPAVATPQDTLKYFKNLSETVGGLVEIFKKDPVAALKAIGEIGLEVGKDMLLHPVETILEVTGIGPVLKVLGSTFSYMQAKGEENVELAAEKLVDSIVEGTKEIILKLATGPLSKLVSEKFLHTFGEFIEKAGGKVVRVTDEVCKGVVEEGLIGIYEKSVGV